MYLNLRTYIHICIYIQYIYIYSIYICICIYVYSIYLSTWLCGEQIEGCFQARQSSGVLTIARNSAKRLPARVTLHRGIRDKNGSERERETEREKERPGRE